MDHPIEPSPLVRVVEDDVSQRCAVERALGRQYPVGPEMRDERAEAAGPGLDDLPGEQVRVDEG